MYESLTIFDRGNRREEAVIANTRKYSNTEQDIYF